MALTGVSGFPAARDRTSSVFQPVSRSAGVSPGSPQSWSISGSPGPPPTPIVLSAARTAGGMGGGRRPGTRIRPRESTRQLTALASTVAGLRSTPPQLPE